MSIESDLASIDEAILAQRIGHLAATARAAQSQVEPYENGYIHPREMWGGYEAREHPLAARGMHQVQPYRRIAEDYPEPFRRPPWQRWCIKWVSIAVVVALAIVIAGWVIDEFLGGLPGLFAIIGAIVLVSILCRMGGGGGNGRSFTFTGTGRMH